MIESEIIMMVAGRWENGREFFSEFFDYLVSREKGKYFNKKGSRLLFRAVLLYVFLFTAMERISRFSQRGFCEKNLK